MSGSKQKPSTYVLLGDLNDKAIISIAAKTRNIIIISKARSCNIMLVLLQYSSLCTKQFLPSSNFVIIIAIQHDLTHWCRVRHWCVSEICHHCFCPCSAPRDYLNQWRFIVNWIPENKFDSNWFWMIVRRTQYEIIVIERMKLLNVVCNKAIISSRAQCVKRNKDNRSNKHITPCMK